MALNSGMVKFSRIWGIKERLYLVCVILQGQLRLSKELVGARTEGQHSRNRAGLLRDLFPPLGGKTQTEM